MISGIGFDNIQPFIGVVEDREEGGAGQGRVRVRCFGIHPPYYVGGDDPNRVETEDLPWAIVLQSGNGKMWSYPDIAEWVFGFFLDGRDAQHPMILGTIAGADLQLPSGPHGYSEVGKSGTNPYVKDSTLAYEKFGRQAIPPQLSGEDITETPLLLQQITQKTGVNSEQISRLLAGFKPYVKVNGVEEPSQQTGGSLDSSLWQTHYGKSYIEMNGTRGNESVTITHDKGSTIQLDSGGNVKIKSFGTLYQIAEDGNINIHSDGTLNLHSKHGDLNINCENGTTNLVVGGDMNHVVTGDYNLVVGGRIAMSAGGGIEGQASRISLMANAEHISLYSDHDVKIGAGRKLSMGSIGDMHVSTGSNMNMLSDGEFRVTGEGQLSLNSSASVDIDGGPNVNINSGSSISADAIPQGKSADGGLVPYKPQVEQPPEMGIVTTDLNNGYSSIGVISSSDIDDFDSGTFTSTSGSTTNPADYSPNPNAGAGSTERASEAYDYFVNQGWTPEQAAGIVGNLQAESGSNLRIDTVGDGGQAYGIAQWHPDRQANFEKQFGKSIDQSTFQEQLEFVQWELDNTESGAANKIRNTTTASDAAWAVDKYYERSAGLHTQQRMDNAVRISQEKG